MHPHIIDIAISIVLGEWTLRVKFVVGEWTLRVTQYPRHAGRGQNRWFVEWPVRALQGFTLQAVT
jgi:hypothetical protein